MKSVLYHHKNTNKYHLWPFLEYYRRELQLQQNSEFQHHQSADLQVWHYGEYASHEPDLNGIHQGIQAKRKWMLNVLYHHKDTSKYHLWPFQEYLHKGYELRHRLNYRLHHVGVRRQHWLEAGEKCYQVPKSKGWKEPQVEVLQQMEECIQVVQEE